MVSLVTNIGLHDRTYYASHDYRFLFPGNKCKTKKLMVIILFNLLLVFSEIFHPWALVNEIPVPIST